jgi:hypothetical protein
LIGKLIEEKLRKEKKRDLGKNKISKTFYHFSVDSCVVAFQSDPDSIAKFENFDLKHFFH